MAASSKNEQSLWFVLENQQWSTDSNMHDCTVTAAIDVLIKALVLFQEIQLI